MYERTSTLQERPAGETISHDKLLSECMCMSDVGRSDKQPSSGNTKEDPDTSIDRLKNLQFSGLQNCTFNFYHP